MANYKLGKLPARKGAASFLFGNYFDARKLPQPPAAFGHYKLVDNWFGLANDKYGNCVWAGAAHEHMLWSRTGGRPRSRFTIQDVLSDYSAVTGFDPKKPDTDQGTDMTKAASYRRKTGVIDAAGKRHMIDAYVALQAGDYDQTALATYITGATGIGVQLPSYAMQDFDDGKAWDVSEHKSHIIGGHYIPVVGRAANGNLVFVSWGKTHEMTQAFYERYCDEGLAYVSLEILNDKLISPEGFDQAALLTNLKHIGGGHAVV